MDKFNLKKVYNFLKGYILSLKPRITILWGHLKNLFISIKDFFKNDPK